MAIETLGTYWFMPALEKAIASKIPVTRMYFELRAIAPVVRKTEFLAIGRMIQGRADYEEVMTRMPKGRYISAAMAQESPYDLKKDALYRFKGTYTDPATGKEETFQRALSTDKRMAIWDTESEMEGEIEGSNPQLAKQMTGIRLVSAERGKGVMW